MVTSELWSASPSSTRLPPVGAVQGARARYKGARKNTLDLRRCAAVANLQRFARAA